MHPAIAMLEIASVFCAVDSSNEQRILETIADTASNPELQKSDISEIDWALDSKI